MADKPPRKRAPRKAATKKATPPKITAADREKARLASVTPINRDPDTRRRAGRTGHSPTSPKGLAIHERRAKALQLRRMGQTYPQIVDTLRELHPDALSEAYDARMARADVKAMLDSVNVEAVTDYLQEDLALLLAMQRRFFTAAMNGDTRSGALMLRILERRARYLGLDSPIKHVLTDGDGNAVPLAIESAGDLNRAALDAIDSLLPHVSSPELTGTIGPGE